MPFTGYHLYVAAGSIDDIDFSTPTQTFGQVALGDLVGFGFAASTSYTAVLRPVKDDLETPDISAQVPFVTDGAGEWVGLRPDPVTSLTATKKADGVIRLAWTHRIFAGATPDDFYITYGTTPSATGNTATVTYAGVKKYTKDIDPGDEQTYWFKVYARDGSIQSTPIRVGGITPDQTAPAQPSIVTDTTWRTLQ